MAKLSLISIISLFYLTDETQTKFIITSADHFDTCFGNQPQSGNSKGEGEGLRYDLNVTSPDLTDDGNIVINGVVTFKAKVIEPWKVAIRYIF